MFLSAVAFFIQACVTDYYLANRFVVQETDIPVLIIPPSELILTYTPVHPDSIQPDTSDGNGNYRPDFLPAVDDSVFVAHFMNSLRNRLDLLYVKHYGPDQLDEFFELEEPGYIFIIAQMELLEYNETEYFEGRRGTDRYIARENIRVLENNVWFEFLKLHDPDFDMQVLFNIHATSDYVDGRFLRLNDGSVVFDPDRYPLTISDVYDLAWYSGEINADKIFDHIMNIHVRREYGRDTPYYFRYDMDTHSIYESVDPPFIEITQPAGDEQ